jgi:hypothetical protein
MADPIHGFRISDGRTLRLNRVPIRSVETLHDELEEILEADIARTEVSLHREGILSHVKLPPST